MSRVSRLIAIAWIGVSLSQGAGAAEPVLTQAQRAKAPIAVLERAELGEEQGLLVLLDDTAIRQEVADDLARRKRKTEDDAALALKATRYQALRQRLLPLIKPEEGGVRRAYSHLPMALVGFRGPLGLKRLLARGEVLAVYPDARLYAHLSQSLPLIGQPTVAQTMGRTGAGTTVAVVDTGVDYTRAEFGSCTAPGVPAGCRVVVSQDIAADDGQRDDIGHGTWVSGTVAGTATGAKLAVLDVFANGSALSSDVIGGINWAISNRSAYNIVAINLSLGDGLQYTSTCPGANPFRTPIINAKSAGILSIVSSGNEGYSNGLASPACTPEAVSVGAVYDTNVGARTWTSANPDCTDSTTAADQVACFSNSASYLTLLAPGALITVTGVTAAGTSLASPFVSGAVAVLAEAYPGDSYSQRLARLTGTGKQITDARNGVTKPRVDLLAAQGAPANDAFAAATTLSGTSGQASGWNLNASKETGEPSHAGNAGGKSVWWQWTAPGAGQVALDTHGSGFNTLLAVYTGASVAALTSVAGNDDDGSAGSTSGVSFHASAGTVYRIAVDGYAAAAGAVTLNWSFTADPPQADLSISGGATPDPVTAGSPLTYSLSVLNQGPDAASGVTLTAQLDANSGFTSASLECTHTAGSVACALGTLASGASASVQIVATPAVAGSVSLGAGVASGTADPVAGNNGLTLTTSVAAVSPPATGDGDGDVPLLPAWALALLASGLVAVGWRRGAGR